jgi:hydroxylamine dehydrogenase
VWASPNTDGTIGNCTACHTRHTSSVRIARLPSTCAHVIWGQIIRRSKFKHGVLFQAQERLLDLDAPPKTLTTRDMFVPTCATCHMSGINGMGITYDPSERLSFYLANAITEKRPNYAAAKMKQVCSQRHTPALIDRRYSQAEQVVGVTSGRVRSARI